MTKRDVYTPICQLLCFVASLFCIVSLTHAQYFPAPDPPMEDRSDITLHLGITRQFNINTATTEWTLHKTPDGQHPDGVEQARLWLINHARQDPTVEGVWLATSEEPDIARGRSFFGVDLQLLQSEFAALQPKPPAAFDVRLYDAAQAHSEALIARDSQDHDGQFSRIDDAGFQFTQARGNVFSFASNALNAHAAFNIDWGGNDGTGMQSGRGHRLAIMAIDGDYTNVGIASISENDPTTQVGPLVMTGNYARALANGVDHFNRFVVGTVWQDLNTNDRYDADEGYAGVTVMPDQGTYFAVTAAGGGYAIPITTPGEYTMTFSGGTLSASETRSVVVETESVLLDYKVGVLPRDGDVNEDGILTSDDARRVLQYFVGILVFNDMQQSQADINQDGAITPSDALCIFHEFMGVPSCLD